MKDQSCHEQQAVVPLFVIAGPSGVGKGTLVRRLLAANDRIWLSVSATTRPPRPGEMDGVDYRFVSDDEFDDMVEAGQMLEWATVHKVKRYGTPRGPVLEALSRGRVPLLEIDLEGARQVRSSMPEAFHIFIEPPSMAELEARLRGRGTENEEEIARRLLTAQTEMAARGEFDACVVNDDVSRATAEILQIMGLAQ